MGTMRKKEPQRDRDLLPGQMFDIPKTTGKLTFRNVVKDFKSRHPTLAKQILKWQGWGYATVRIWLEGGMIVDYNYDDHAAVIISSGEDDR